MRAMLPRQGVPIADSSGTPSNPFYAFLQDVERAINSDVSGGEGLADAITAIARALGSPDGSVANIPEQSQGGGQILGPQSVHVNGALPNMVQLVLEGDAADPGPTFRYGTDAEGAKGWFPIADALAGSDTATLTVGADGVVRFSLPELVDAGGGALQKTLRDEYGRLAGTSEATTTDLPEGANLYHTDERVDARIDAQKAQPGGLATLDANAKLDAGQLPALAITETFVVNTEAAMLALDVQQGDVAVRSDLQASFILTAEPASTLSNWQELLVPTGVGVASFNGRTGTVTPQSGDYTAAQVGADSAGSAATAQSAAQSYADGKVTQSITNGDTTHAPSGGAVFDALAGKVSKSGDTMTGSLLVQKDAASPDQPKVTVENTRTTSNNETHLELISNTALARVFYRQSDHNFGFYLTNSGGTQTRLRWDGATNNWDFNGGSSLSVGGSAVAIDAGVVHVSGDETVGGIKRFTSRTTFLPNLSGAMSLTAGGGVNYLQFGADETNGSWQEFRITPYGSSGYRFRITVDGMSWFAGNVRPSSDNTFSCGVAGGRWTEVYAATGTINTSDAREKTTPRDMTPAEISCGLDIARLPCIYQWLHAIEDKGEDVARLHAGPTVQAVIATMESHGLDPFRYGFVCFDQWDEHPEIRDEETDEVTQEYRPAGDRYSLRPSELAHFVMRGLAHRQDRVEERLAALESE